MGWNESRLWLVAPGWLPQVDRGNVEGVGMLSFIPEVGKFAAPIAADELRDWFLSRGFKTFSCDGFTLQNAGFEISLEVTDGAATSIRLTFAIYDPVRRSMTVNDEEGRWRSLVHAVVTEWGYQLLDPETWLPVPATDFKFAIRRTHSYKEIASSIKVGET